jgi:hypothetical protein
MSAHEKEQKETFISRWSRRKQEAREQPQRVVAKPADARPMPELPPVDTLSFDSDFRGFMDNRVDDVVRRIALKKLFSDPRFNITDGLDDYAENYAALEDLSAAMVEKLQHARRTLRDTEAEEDDLKSQTPPAEEHSELPTQAAEEAPAIADAGSPEDDGVLRHGADETEQRSS